MNILVLGATGKVAIETVRELKKQKNLTLRLFVRNRNKLPQDLQNLSIIQGDVNDRSLLERALEDIDLVYANLGPYNMLELAESVTTAMKKQGVQRLIWTATGGMYRELIAINQIIGEIMLRGSSKKKGSYLHGQLEAATFIEKSGLNYTILRPHMLTNGKQRKNKIQISPTKESAMHGLPISRKTLAYFISKIIMNDKAYSNQSIGISSTIRDGIAI